MTKYWVERNQVVREKEKEREKEAISEAPVEISLSASFNELSELSDVSIWTIDCDTRALIL